jgi:hypothetical protein
MRISKEEKLYTWFLLKDSQRGLKDDLADGDVSRKKKSCIPGFC